MRGKELICTRGTQPQQIARRHCCPQTDQLVPPGLGWDVDRVQVVAKDIPCGRAAPFCIPARAVSHRAHGHHPLFWGGFAFSHVLTFSHAAFKLQHWFQFSLVCKQINSANTFQILSQCKTNIALEKSNYRTDSSSTKQPQRFLLISPLSYQSKFPLRLFLPG